MHQVVFWSSKDRVVDENEKMGPINSLINWCYITTFLLPGDPEHSSWNFKGSLTGTFVVSGSSLLFYRSWEMPKIADFSSSDGVMHWPVAVVR